MHFNRLAFAMFALVPLALGCKKESASNSAGSSTTPKAVLQLNWKPEAEFGGFYAASEMNAFKDHGLDVEVREGGVGTPTIQMVGAGKAEFGIGSADEVVIARSQGNNIVAVFAAFQTDPHGLMAHPARGFKSIADVFNHPGTVAIQAGYPYAMFLKHLYDFGKVKIVPSPGGDLSAFRNDPNLTQQCFVTSEPITARAGGIDVQTFLIADTGYNPYTTVVVTSDAYLKAHPDVVKAMVTACREGWDAYQHDPSRTNAVLAKLNPSMTMPVLAESAKLQEPLVRTKELGDRAIGSMTRERWDTLGKQLVQGGVIEKAPPVDECFVDPEYFAPRK